jgi:basic membrane protein A
MKKLLIVLSIIFITSSLAFAEGTGKEEVSELKFAAILAGSIQDDGWNALAYEALQELEKEEGYETSYNERTNVPDVERVIGEYVSSGYNVIWTHGAQYTSTVVGVVADQYPNVSFIVEGDGPNPQASEKPNVWYTDRNHIQGHYPIAYTAALLTKTKKIGYVGPIPLPFTRAELHVTLQAIEDAGTGAKFEYVFCGDFNDPVKAKQAAEALIAKGCDFLINPLDLGEAGIYQAIEEAEGTIYTNSNYKRRSGEGIPGYVTSDLFDFYEPMKYMLGEIENGNIGGFYFYEYGPGKPRSTEMPLSNAPSNINKKVQKAIDDIQSGELQIVVDFSEPK